MASKPEQIYPKVVTANWRSIKRQTARWRRRDARRLQEDATPWNRYHGWVA